MRRFSLAALSLLFAAMFAVSANAQAGAAQTGAGKFGLVNSYLFADEKPGGGITKFKNALTALEAEFKPLNDELKTMQTKYEGMDRIYRLHKWAGILAVGIAATHWLIEMSDDILKAMNDYAKAKGYAVIMDGPKLLEAQILMGFDEKSDVTLDFIAFYNARK